MSNFFHEIRKYNYWDGQDIKTGFKRSEYLNNITRFINNKLVKVLVGQRRVGKSYLMRQIMHDLIYNRGVNPHNIFYLNKEYIVFDAIKTHSDLLSVYQYYENELEVSGKAYIFLDEVQNIEGWEKFVNSYSQDFTREYELFITGSNSNLLSGELATLLSGRYIEFQVYSFSLQEYAGFKKKEINKQLFLDYLQTGGLPEMFLLPDEDMKRNYMESLKNTIILRDIVKRQNINDVNLLEDIFKFMMANIGNLTSFSSIIRYFKSKQKKTNYETLSSYAGYLRDTYIVHEVSRYNLKGKQTLGGERKYYLGDLAFKNYLLGFFPSDIGYNLENFVYMQLKRMGYEVFVGVLDNIEIDFIARKKNKIMYVQVAYMLSQEQTIQREFGNLLKIKDNHEKLVVSLDEIKLDNYEGVQHKSPWELK